MLLERLEMVTNTIEQSVERNTNGGHFTGQKCRQPHCGGRLYIDDDGDRRCFTCGRSPDLPTALLPGEEPEKEGRPAGVGDGVVKQKRKYTKRPKTEETVTKPKRQYNKRLEPVREEDIESTPERRAEPAVKGSALFSDGALPDKG